MEEKMLVMVVVMCDEWWWVDGWMGGYVLKERWSWKLEIVGSVRAGTRREGE